MCGEYLFGQTTLCAGASRVELRNKIPPAAEFFAFFVHIYFSLLFFFLSSVLRHKKNENDTLNVCIVYVMIEKFLFVDVRLHVESKSRKNAHATN